jgi:peptidoglycan/LPS O-acetylase OafA/YrhL
MLVSSRHIATLDGLRGIAAIAVLLFHIDEKILNHLIAPSYAPLAVDFFFMLSGFVVARAYEARLLQGMSLSTFAVIRLRRLYPLIFLGVALGALIVGMRAVLKKDIEIQSVAIAAFWAFLLMPWQTKGRPGDLYPLNTPHWSLFFELAINFVYAILAKRLPNYILVAVSLGSLAGLVYAVGTNYYSIGDLGARPPTFMLGFLRVTFPFSIGVLLYRVVRPPLFQRDYSTLLCGLLFFVLICPWFPKNWHSEILFIGLVFPGIIIAGVCCPNANEKQGPLRWLGELSYPLYATHEPLIRLSVNFAQILKWEERPIVVGILSFALAIAAAAGAYVFWDRPIRDWLK